MTSDPCEDGAVTKAEQAVEAVLTRIAQTVTHCHCALRSDVMETMRRRYLPGFQRAFEDNEDFWKENCKQIMRMAAYAAAAAGLFAEKDRSGQLQAEDDETYVETDHLMLAMGMSRSACLTVRRLRVVYGIPCNDQNFDISLAMKLDLTVRLAAVVVDLFVPGVAGSIRKFLASRRLRRKLKRLQTAP